MKGSDTMTEFILKLMLNFKLNLALSSLALLTFLFNYAVLKLKSEYKGFKYQMLIIMLVCPYFNGLFLLFNCLLATTKVGGYRVIKVRRKSRSKSRVQAKA